MNTNVNEHVALSKPRPTGKRRTLKSIFADRWLYLFIAPAFITVLVFSYFPMWGLIMAFQHFDPMKGVLHSSFVGLDNFKTIFVDPDMPRILRNTLGISVIGFSLGFPLPIILSVFLNELRFLGFKRLFQTASYLPHFISWVAVAGLAYTVFDYNNGVVNKLISLFGLQKIQFFATPQLFWILSVAIAIWKELGWACIIYIAVIAGIDQEQYEAAIIDGAGRYKRMIYITLPGMLPIISLGLILTAGSIFSGAGICPGFDGVYNLYNPVISEYAQTIDMWVYQQGIQKSNFSFGTSVGLFFSVINITFILVANASANRINDMGIF